MAATAPGFLSPEVNTLEVNTQEDNNVDDLLNSLENDNKDYSTLT